MPPPWRSLLDKLAIGGEIWNQRNQNGEIFAEMQTISAVCDEDGHTRHLAWRCSLTSP